MCTQHPAACRGTHLGRGGPRRAASARGGFVVRWLFLLDRGLRSHTYTARLPVPDHSADVQVWMHMCARHRPFSPPDVAVLLLPCCHGQQQPSLNRSSSSNSQSSLPRQQQQRRKKHHQQQQEQQQEQQELSRSSKRSWRLHKQQLVTRQPPWTRLLHLTPRPNQAPQRAARACM